MRLSILLLALACCAQAAAPPAPTRSLTAAQQKEVAALQARLQRHAAAGEHAEAARLARQVAAFRARKQGRGHWQAVEARLVAEWWQRLATMREEDRAAVARAQMLTSQGMTLVNGGRFREAEKPLRAALDIFREVLGAGHLYTASGYNNVAYCLYGLGKEEDALPLQRRSLDIYSKVLGEEHPTTASSCSNLATSLSRQGKYEEALPLFRAALDVNLKALGDAHPATASSYGNLALCLSSQGKYGQALPLCRKALDVTIKASGEDHPSTARCYANLASCLCRQGKYGEALPLQRRSLDIYSKVLGEEHPNTASSYNNLAGCLDGQTKYEEALPLYRRALDVCIKCFGKSHPTTATGYSNLALCLGKQGKYGEALPLMRKALELSLRAPGANHPNTAISYRNLAVCLGKQGKYGEALPLCRKALSITSKALGEDHPDTATSYNDVARCLNQLGRRAEALRLLQASLPGQEAARFHKAASGFDRSVASAADASPHAMLAAGLARAGQPRNAFRHAEHALARGLLDDLIASDPARMSRMAALAAELSALEKRIVPLLGLQNPSAEQSALRDDLLRRRRSLSAALARLASEASAAQVLPLERIQRQVPEDAALVLWVDDFGEHLGCVLRHSGPPAWVLLPGSGKHGAWTAEDDALPSRAYAALTDPAAPGDALAALYRQRLAPLEPHLRGVKRLLVVPAGVMAAVPAEALTARWSVSYVPSGSALARAAELPRKVRPASLLVLADPAFGRAAPERLAAPAHGLLVRAVLPGGLAARSGLRAGDVLLEYAGKALRSPADLKPAQGDARVPVKLWREGQALAGRLPAGELGVSVDERPIAEALAAWRAERDRLLASRGGDWQPLPGTRLEARSLAALVPSATALLGSDASEQRLEALAASGGLARYTLLHLATHGEADPGRPTQTALILAQDRLPGPKGQEARSLAGKPPLEGRLTVEAVLKSWRLDAELVTLSACQTGLGRDAAGEGMLGFAQALLQRGARSVVLSRWRVDDAATSLLMVRFYENLLGKREGLKSPLPKAEALAEAKAWLRGLPRGEAQRRLSALAEGLPRGERATVGKALPARRADASKGDRPFEHPYFWAAFVLVGDPR